MLVEKGCLSTRILSNGSLSNRILSKSPGRNGPVEPDFGEFFELDVRHMLDLAFRQILIFL